MHCDDGEILILLAQSGELSPRKRRRLEAHLAACGRCRGSRAGLERISAASRGLLPDKAPGAAVLERIRLAAQVAANRPRRIFFRRPAFPSLAAAAAAALLIGSWLALAPARRLARISEMHALLNVVSEQALPLRAAERQPAEAALRALADDLLILEGLSVETTGPEVSGEATPPSAPEPTVLRPRSGDGLPARRCV
jgi:anti-sigma factor RsiW